VPPRTPTSDSVALALAALTATLGNERLAQRFLSLSGLTPPELRQRAADPALLSAVIRFLEAHEPDLLSVSEQLGVGPEVLVQARRELEGE
jgi:hypothetical protein